PCLPQSPRIPVPFPNARSAGSMTLKGKRILLGLTGGIAAYKGAELARTLVKSGCDVRAVLTEAATRFVGAATLQALTGQTAWSDLWDPRVADNMAHIELSRARDLIVVAPASADFIAKAAHGLADDLLTTLVLARRCPMLVAPAMNVEMWDNPATQRNLLALRDDGVAIAGPVAGDRGGAKPGMAPSLEPAEILAEIEAFFQPKSLAGKRVLVTAGPTEEPIDPVRVITNASSGKMGFAVARAARAVRPENRAGEIRRRKGRRRDERHFRVGGRGVRLPRRESRCAEDQEARRR